MAIKFATLTQENINFLKSLHIGEEFVSQDEVTEIEDAFDLKAKDEDELRSIRNSVVRFYADIKSEARKNYDWFTFDMMHNNMSGVTAVIDNILYGWGYEV